MSIQCRKNKINAATVWEAIHELADKSQPNIYAESVLHYFLAIIVEKWFQRTFLASEKCQELLDSITSEHQKTDADYEVAIGVVNSCIAETAMNLRKARVETDAEIRTFLKEYSLTVTAPDFDYISNHLVSPMSVRELVELCTDLKDARMELGLQKS